MGTIRAIKRVLHSQPTLEGAGVHLKRAFFYQLAPELDPFLLLDDFHSDNPADYLPGFPWHPHRGIETITYMLFGEVEHGDSLGHRGVIHSGDVQWMTAGSGIIHQEMPKGRSDGLMWGFQLWANLPAANKMMDPRYREIHHDQIPEVTIADGARVRIVCGEVNGVRGPVQDIVIQPEYLDVSLPAGASFSHSTTFRDTAFAYVIEGRGNFGPGLDRPASLGLESLVIFTDGDQVVASTASEGMRFLLVTGRPLKEPVAWYGPIVMNTEAELVTAFEDYQRGTFLKHKPLFS